MKEYKQKRSKEDQQKTEEWIEESNRKGQEGVSWEPLCDQIPLFQKAGHYDLKYMKKKGTRLERKQWNSKHWHWRL